MQKKQYWNVKTLVFMALLIAMHLVQVGGQAVLGRQ